MGRREELGQILHRILNSRNVYFQPPVNIQLHYPAIIYERDNIVPIHADNQPYQLPRRYKVTVIDPNPDSEYVSAVAQLPMCSFSQHFVSDNLNHDVFEIYY